MDRKKAGGTEITIKAKDGGKFQAYLNLPVTDLPAPAIIVIQEIFGVNRNMRDICDNLTQMGYVAICPDLFWRQKPGVELTDKTEAEWQQAFGFFKGFDLDLGIKDLIATLDFVRNHKECTGRVGVVGYCLGGKLAYLMAARSMVDCSVGYYGVDIENFLDETGAVKNPLLLHIAEKDAYVPPAAQAKIKSALKGNARAEIYVYEGVDHAFARIGGKNFNAEAAMLANMRTADFLATHLTNPDDQNR